MGSARITTSPLAIDLIIECGSDLDSLQLFTLLYPQESKYYSARMYVFSVKVITEEMNEENIISNSKLKKFISN